MRRSVATKRGGTNREAPDKKMNSIGIAHSRKNLDGRPPTPPTPSVLKAPVPPGRGFSLLECKQVTALNAGANKRPRPRNLSPRASRLHCLVGDFDQIEEGVVIYERLFTHVLEPERERQKRKCLDRQRGGRGKGGSTHRERSAKTILAHRL